MLQIKKGCMQALNFDWKGKKYENLQNRRGCRGLRHTP